MIESGDLRRYLDIIDNVRTRLSCLHKDVFDRLLAKIPQIVMCGPQSSGKSSLIRRISGITLPTASSACTRMPTMVCVRHDKLLHTDSVRVELIHPGGKCDMYFSTGDDGTVEDSVCKAQEEALRLSGEKFVTDYQIKVSVFGAGRCNVTLVDLPGFHNSDDSDTKIVEDMVSRFTMGARQTYSSFENR
jgi:energy-coupling factor transporter ATP-binding protein EcfA2